MEDIMKSTFVNQLSKTNINQNVPHTSASAVALVPIPKLCPRFKIRVHTKHTRRGPIINQRYNWSKNQDAVPLGYLEPTVLARGKLYFSSDSQDEPYLPFTRNKFWYVFILFFSNPSGGVDEVFGGSFPRNDLQYTNAAHTYFIIWSVSCSIEKDPIIQTLTPHDIEKARKLNFQNHFATKQSSLLFLQQITFHEMGFEQITTFHSIERRNERMEHFGSSFRAEIANQLS